MTPEAPHLELVAFSHALGLSSITICLARARADANYMLCKYRYNVPGNPSLPGINAPGGNTSEDCCEEL